MISATNSTPLRRRRLRLLPVLAVLAGSAAWAPPTSAQPAPTPATMEFTVTPDEFVADGTFTVTIEGTGCVDPDGPAEAPLTAVFWLKGGAIGSDGNDLIIGVYEAEADGSYAGSSEVVTTFSDRGPITANGEGLIEGFCTRNWLPTDPSDLVATGQQEITIVAPPDYVPTTSTSTSTPLTTTTEPSAPVATTPPAAAADAAQPVAAAPAYTG